MTMKVVILGETDSGKTTLAGHFLVKCGFIDLSNEEIIQVDPYDLRISSDSFVFNFRTRENQ